MADAPAVPATLASRPLVGGLLVPYISIESGSERECEFPKLTQAWRELIAARRAGGAR